MLRLLAEERETYEVRPRRVDGFRLLKAAARDGELSGTAVKVLVLLLEHFNTEKGMAWPGQSRLAELIGVKRTAINNAVVTLRERGYIEVENRKEPGSAENAVNAYRFPSFYMEGGSHERWLPSHENEQGSPPDVARVATRDGMGSHERWQELTGENLPDENVEAAVAAKPPRARKSIKVELSEDAAKVVADWCAKQGRSRLDLNPTQARLLEEAVSEIGFDWLEKANTWAASKGIAEFDKARRAAKTMSSGDRADVAAAGHRNGVERYTYDRAKGFGVDPGLAAAIERKAIKLPKAEP